MKKITSFFCLITCLLMVSTSSFAVKFSNIADGKFLVVRGVVESISGHNFLLRSSVGKIIIELDDHDNFNEAKWIKVGDSVVVSGKMDKDRFEKRSIEAASVYIADLDLYVFASDVDDESLFIDKIVGADGRDPVSVAGTVQNITGDNYKIKTAYGEMNVNVAKLTVNPSSRKGVLRINVGDQVIVDGILDKDLFSSPEITAIKMIKLFKIQ